MENAILKARINWKLFSLYIVKIEITCVKTASYVFSYISGLVREMKAYKSV